MSNQFPDKTKIADVRDINSLRETVSGDVVINLAAIHSDDIRDSKEYQRTNVDGSENIARVCTEKGISKIIFTSTVAVYGFAPPNTDETGSINPFNEYGRTKFQAEEKLRLWRESGDNSLIIVRPTVIFGEHNRGNVYNLLKQVAARKFIMIGQGQNKKSMAYIDNVAAFLDACIKTDRSYGLFNYTDTPDLKMNELVLFARNKLHNKKNLGFILPEWLGLVLGNMADFAAFMFRKNFPVSLIRVKKFTSETSFASSKEDLDDFVAPIPLLCGLERTLQSEFISPDQNAEIFITE